MAIAKKAAPKKAAAKPVAKKAAAPKKAAAKPAAKKAAPKKAVAKPVAKKAAAPKKKTARKPNAAFMKALKPSAVLAAVVGAAPLPRTEVTKKLWGYIKKNSLQDKLNKRNIKADDKLKAVFGGKAVVNMFEMTKLIAKHLS